MKVLVLGRGFLLLLVVVLDRTMNVFVQGGKKKDSFVWAALRSATLVFLCLQPYKISSDVVGSVVLRGGGSMVPW